MTSGMNAPVRRVLVIEDEPLTRGLLVSLLAGAGYEVEEAADAHTAVRLIRECDPDALVVDLNLGSGPGGAEVLTACERIAPWAALVVLTNSPTPMAAGLDPEVIPERAAYLHKRSVMAGDLLLETLASVLADGQPRRDDRQGPDRFHDLSRDQMEVLRLVAEGLSNAEIGARRGTTAHAVEQIFQRVLRNLDIPKDPSINPRVVAARLFYTQGTGPG